MGARFPFDEDSSLPTDFSLLLKNTENKSDLNFLLAKESKQFNWNTDTFNTENTTVFNCLQNDECRMYNDDGLTFEEADNRIICHLWHMIRNGISDVVIRTGD